ncbi:BrnA antitoxin family protein [Rhizobium sp. S-51]|uniref:BrnA antitoxin family protein n=1 Tax=Rhizobium terricola TaxID=2728849 RepID=A0A7Y0FUS0_9HYPH|nr:BrnA antitoxin family protein [Rhizobium terricola]NML73663.1 BrnA antitoxin family protein [Rhizobium terricola]
MPKRYDKELTLEQLAVLQDEDIDTSDVPELDVTFWQQAKISQPEGTEQITLRVKKSVLQAFRNTGKGYQTRMNAVLETYVRSLKK